MLRPATPLTVLLFAAFVLLLISVISVPIVKPIPLGEFNGVSYGVFGYCKGDKCSKIEVGYSPSLLTNDEKGTFNLPPETRTTLSSILIVHPVAAFFTLIMFVLAVVSHFHAPSHSPRYLLGVFILSILTLVLALLSFLIDVLLFVPHLAWGSYVVLAATILIAASGIVSCAMRRTLVSRKARKRRIAENAEMNGENFYNRQAAVAPLAPITAPTITSGVNADKLPSFATFESGKTEADGRTNTGDDERVPLTSRTPTRSPETMQANLNGRPGDDNRYGQGPGGPGPRGYNGGPPQRDQYGNIIPPPQSYGGMRNPDPRNQFGPPGGYRGRGGPPGSFRGRGGGPGYGRGGYNPNGPGGYNPNGPGGYGPGPGPGGMRGGRGPPPGYTGGYGSPGRGGFQNRAASPGAYGFDQSQGSLHSNNAMMGGGRPESLARAESPPPMGDGPVGQAIEMDATTGSRSPAHTPHGFGTGFGALRDSDGDVAGMVGLQQQRQAVESDGSKYSMDEYVPPRQNWPSGGRAHSPLNPLPTALQPAPRRQPSGDTYYEDVDPRFSPPQAPSSMVPAPLVPGGSRGGSPPVGRQAGSPVDSDRGERRWGGGAGAGSSPLQQPGAQTRRQGAPGQNVLLGGNPDFEIGGGAPGGVVPRSAYGGPGGVM